MLVIRVLSISGEDCGRQCRRGDERIVACPRWNGSAAGLPRRLAAASTSKKTASAHLAVASLTNVSSFAPVTMERRSRLKFQSTAVSAVDLDVPSPNSNLPIDWLPHFSAFRGRSTLLMKHQSTHEILDDTLGLVEPLLRAVLEARLRPLLPRSRHKPFPPCSRRWRPAWAGAQTGTGKTAGFTLPMLQRLIAHGRPCATPRGNKPAHPRLDPHADPRACRPGRRKRAQLRQVHAKLSSAW